MLIKTCDPLILFSNHQQNYLADLNATLVNKKAMLKICSLLEENDRLILVGDLFEKTINSWCLNYFSMEEYFCNYDLDADDSLEEKKFLPFEMPDECESKAHNVIVTWINEESNMVNFNSYARSPIKYDFIQIHF